MAVSVESTSTVAEALFVFHTWDKDKYGLPATHRNLIKDFCQRKRNVMKVYATTLDLRLSEAQEKDANDIGVHLIVAERNKWANEKQDPAVLRWLLDHKVHYQRLDELKNVEYVIGYTPETHCAAADIREKLFPGADLVLINCSTASKENGHEFDYKMLDAASEADLLFSLGPLTHKHFEIEYRAERNGKRLCDIPHREIAPIPYVSCKWVNISEDITEPVLFTYGRIDDEEALKRCGPIAAAIGNFSSTRKKHVLGKVTWKIQGIFEKMEKRSSEFFKARLKNGNTQLRLYCNSSIDKLTTHLFQSHLCIPLPSTDQSHFDGIEAMSSAVPLVCIEDTHLAEFINKYLKEYMDSCIVEKTEGHLTNHIQRVFRNIPLAFEKAERLRKTYRSSKQAQTTYEEFAALLTPSKIVRPSEEKTAERPLEVTLNFSLPEDSYHRYRQSEVQHASEERVGRQDADRSDFIALFVEGINTVLASEEGCQQVRRVIEDKCGSVRISFMKKGPLVVTLDAPRLVNLYRLERTTKSGSLAEAIEPLLITDEMKAKAKRAGYPGHRMKLQVTYNQATFQAIQRSLIKRHGGTDGRAFLPDGVSDEVRDDEEQYEPPMKKATSSDHTEVTSVKQCEECKTFEYIYVNECRRRDKEEKLLLDKLANRNSQIEKLKKKLKQSQHIPSKSMTGQEGESKGEDGILGQAFLTDDTRDGLKKTCNRGRDELDSESENEEYVNAEDMDQEECRHHDEQETLPNAQHENQYSRMEEIEKQQSHNMLSKYATYQEEESEDTGNSRETRRLEWNVETLAYVAISFDYPCGVTFSDTNHIAVCNRDNHRVDVIDMVTKRVSYLKFEGRFEKPLGPQDVAISAGNLFFISDRANKQIVVSDEDGEVVNTFGNEHKHFEPFGIALMGSDAVVSDIAEHRIIKYTTDGQYVCEVGGYGKSCGQFDEPYSVAVNSLNQVLATDFHNHRVQVFNSDLQFLYSVGKSGSSPGQLQNPFGINVDSDDNMYVCDFDHHRVAKFTKKGKFDCNLFESDVNYPMYVAVSKATADQFRIAVSQWQANEIKIYFQS